MRVNVLLHYLDNHIIISVNVKNCIVNEFILVAVRGEMFDGNKLSTYRTFKNEFAIELYLRIIVNKIYRSAHAKFKCGVAPLKIETGRYGVNRVPAEEWLCNM